MNSAVAPFAAIVLAASGWFESLQIMMPNVSPSIWNTGVWPQFKTTGAAIAKAFAREGAHVVLHGRDQSALQVVQSDIEGLGGRAVSMVGDVRSFEAIEALRRHAEAQFGPINVLVANAGGNVTPPGPLESIDEDAWHAAIDGNLTATFLTIKIVLPGMKARRRGAIITVSSAAARRPHPGFAYSLRGRQGRHSNADVGRGGPSRTLQHSGQLHRA